MVFTGYRITSNYGWRIHPIHKTKKFHAGIDIVKPTGSKINAFTDGTILYAGLGLSGTGVGGYGNVVCIKPPDGTCHVYAHLKSVNVKVGQKVKKSQVIGVQGATGNVTGEHLHLEIRKTYTPSLGWTSKQENSTLDPIKYFNEVKRVVKKIKEDGDRGKETIDRWQQFMGTVRDGKISTPSKLIMAWQRFLNEYAGAKLKVDGYEGSKTIKAGQKFFGIKQDGFRSKPVSNYDKELQKFLNSYGQ